MFDFSVLITIICSIIIFYFSIVIPIKEKIKNLETKFRKASDEMKVDYGNQILSAQNSIHIATVTSIILTLTVILLYFSSDISPHSLLSTFFELCLKILPFQKNIFCNQYFIFSYATETIFMIILGLFMFIELWSWYTDNWYCTLKYISIALLFVLAGIWLNFAISFFFTYHITVCFYFLSAIFNLAIYFAIALIYLIVFEFI